MQLGLTLDEIASRLTQPEQPLFDWKRDFKPPRNDEARGEFVKDVVAMANATAFDRSTGCILYGVDPRQANPVLGVSEGYDDASLQQLVAATVDPPVTFLYYEIPADSGQRIAVVEVPPSRVPFHIVKRDVGKLREGQALIRDGSSTRGVTRADHIRLYLTVGNGYVDRVLHEYGALAKLTEAQTRQLAQYATEEQRLIRQMEAMVGLPPGSTGLA